MEQIHKFNLIKELKFNKGQKILITILLTLLVFTLPILTVNILTNFTDNEIIISVFGLFMFGITFYTICILEDKWLNNTVIIGEFHIENNFLYTSSQIINVNDIKTLKATKYISIFKTFIKSWKESKKIEIVMKSNEKINIYVGLYSNDVNKTKDLNIELSKLKKSNIDNYKKIEIFE